MKETLLFTDELKEDELTHFAQQLLPELKKSEPFCLVLEGPLGIGKTSLSRHVLQGLGLSEKEPVVSPTYSYLNEYQIGKDYYAHCDLYRLESLELLNDELEVCLLRKFKGYLIEWPKLRGQEGLLEPTHKLRIDPVKDLKNKRKYSFYSFT